MILVAGYHTWHSVKSDMEPGKNPEAHLKAQSILGPVYCVLYAFILSLVAFDLIMSLDHEWVSTLFGAYYFAVCFYAGLAFLAIISTFAIKNLSMDKVIGKKQFHDIGKLLFAFCIVSTDFFYVQFLVIWYGNLPEETRYVLARVGTDPWTTLAWVVLLGLFIIPFVVLVIRKVKLNPVLMAAISVWILIGVWIEKYLLVTPSIIKSSTLPLGFLEPAISLGWLGLFGFCVCSFLERFPVLAISDPKLETALHAEGVHLA